MSVRSSSGHVTEVRSAGSRSPDVDVTTDCATIGGSDNTAAVGSYIRVMSDQPWRRLSDSSTADAASQSSSSSPRSLQQQQPPPPLVTTPCAGGDRRPSFMINDILGGDRSATLARSSMQLPARPTPLVSATATARLASMPPTHFDFSAMAAHRQMPSSSAAAAAAAAAVACLQRRSLDDCVDIERCLQALPAAPDFRRLPPVGHDVLHGAPGPWMSPTVDAVSQLTKGTSSHSAECGSDVDVDLDDDNDVDSDSSLVG